MKILQRNLNGITFVVWEMKRNVSVVSLVVATRSSGPPASQPVSCLTRLCWSLCHLAEGAYTIRLLFVNVSVMWDFTQDSWKMYRYIGKIIKEMLGSVAGGTPCRNACFFVLASVQYSTVEVHQSGLMGRASHSDMQKILIIGFFFENRLHCLSEVRLLQLISCTRV